MGALDERLAVARHLANLYKEIPRLEALFVAGSVARGLADQFSDLELNILWREPPSQADRMEAIRTLKEARVAYIADYEEEEWSERYYIHGLPVDISGFLTATIQDYIQGAALRFDPTPAKQWVLAALQDGMPLVGTITFKELQKTLTYPDELARATITHAGDFSPLWYYARLGQREDAVMLQQVLARATLTMLTILCGLNRLYLPHPDFKWVKYLVGRMTRIPTHFLSRLETARRASPPDAIRAMQELAHETLLLVREEWPALAPEPEKPLPWNAPS